MITTDTLVKWSSIIAPDDKERWHVLLHKIAKGLLRPEPENRPLNIGYTEGIACKALFFFELARYFNSSEYFQLANQQFELCLQKYFEEPQKFNFADGLAGLGWTFQHVKGFNQFDLNVEDFMLKSDQFLQRAVDYTLLTDNTDFFWGLPGIMQYFIIRHESKENYDALDKYLTFIENKYMQDESDDCFYNNTAGHNHTLNLTMAHGLPAMTSTLLSMYERGLFTDRLKPIIIRFVKFIASTEINRPGCVSHYSFIFDKGKEQEPSRMAWCQGDLTLGLLFLRAAKTFDLTELETKALDILLDSTKRKEHKDTSIVDTSFCHGTVGLAHMFNRAYHYSQLKEFKETALYWFEKTHEMGIYESDYVEFQAMMDGLEMEPTLGRADGLTMGSVGIGLSVISALSKENPYWDSGMLLSS